MKQNSRKADVVQLLGYDLNDRLQTQTPIPALGEDRQHLFDERFLVKG